MIEACRRDVVGSAGNGTSRDGSRPIVAAPFASEKLWPAYGPDITTWSGDAITQAVDEGKAFEAVVKKQARKGVAP